MPYAPGPIFTFSSASSPRTVDAYGGFTVATCYADILLDRAMPMDAMGAMGRYGYASQYQYIEKGEVSRGPGEDSCKVWRWINSRR